MLKWSFHILTCIPRCGINAPIRSNIRWSVTEYSSRHFHQILLHNILTANRFEIAIDRIPANIFHSILIANHCKTRFSVFSRHFSLATAQGQHPPNMLSTIGQHPPNMLSTIGQHPPNMPPTATQAPSSAPSNPEPTVALQTPMRPRNTATVETSDHSPLILNHLPFGTTQQPPTTHRAASLTILRSPPNITTPPHTNTQEVIDLTETSALGSKRLQAEPPKSARAFSRRKLTSIVADITNTLPTQAPLELDIEGCMEQLSASYTGSQ